jgi:hypothetical protein
MESKKSIPSTQSVIISDIDLFTNKYDIKILEDNVNHLDSKILLRTQILTAEFCIKYILNDDYASCIEDTYYFTDGKVLSNQPHLTQKDLDDVREKNKN